MYERGVAGTDALFSFGPGGGGVPFLFPPKASAHRRQLGLGHQLRDPHAARLGAFGGEAIAWSLGQSRSVGRNSSVTSL